MINVTYEENAIVLTPVVRDAKIYLSTFSLADIEYNMCTGVLTIKRTD